MMKFRRTKFSQEPKAEGEGSYTIIENSPILEKSSSIQHDHKHSRIQVSNINELSVGDHICFKTEFGYEHHGVILNSFPHEETPVLNVIEVLGIPIGDQMKELASVVECRTHTFPTDGSLYMVQYEEGECLPASQVTLNATLMVGKPVKYNIFTKNCEHYASALKTGTGKSECVSMVAATTAGISHPPSSTILLEDLLKELGVKTNSNPDTVMQCVPDAEAIVTGIFDNMVEEALELVQSSESVINDVHFEFVQSKSGKKKKRKKGRKSKNDCTIL